MNDKAKMKREEALRDQTRYVAHFEYDDLVKRLLDVKKQKKDFLSLENPRTERDTSLGLVKESPAGGKMTKKQKLLNAISERKTNSGEIVLPKLRTPKVKVADTRLNGSGDLELGIKSSLNLKLQPINKAKNSNFFLAIENRL